MTITIIAITITMTTPHWWNYSQGILTSQCKLSKNHDSFHWLLPCPVYLRQKYPVRMSSVLVHVKVPKLCIIVYLCNVITLTLLWRGGHPLQFLHQGPHTYMCVLQFLHQGPRTYVCVWGGDTSTNTHKFHQSKPITSTSGTNLLLIGLFVDNGSGLEPKRSKIK